MWVFDIEVSAVLSTHLNSANVLYMPQCLLGDVGSVRKCIKIFQLKLNNNAIVQKNSILKDSTCNKTYINLINIVNVL